MSLLWRPTQAWKVLYHNSLRADSMMPIIYPRRTPNFTASLRSIVRKTTRVSRGDRSLGRPPRPRQGQNPGTSPYNQTGVVEGGRPPPYGTTRSSLERREPFCPSSASKGTPSWRTFLGNPAVSRSRTGWRITAKCQFRIGRRSSISHSPRLADLRSTDALHISPDYLFGPTCRQNAMG
ncbi:hypothetical protein Cgig2_015783 [Carnegiea gigantea]|uniref:Uncharacterized protein n=1 Tax=Carnegiea gigantea TaxID=171969 RepID=A0A9Q1KI04_9CARY|nr:hypothetical protein Cgig2_015783 [Carnegiea gigantea]